MRDLKWVSNPGAIIPEHIFFENHHSSTQDTGFISEYIAGEEAAGWYSRGFLQDELEELIGLFRTSPLGLVPKPHSNALRMIQDMSYPRGSLDILLVNAGVDLGDFPTAWGKFDDAAALILSLPPGCLAATFDIAVAYRMVPVCPDQQYALCVYWGGKIHVDRALMFGLSSSAGVFGSVTDMLVAIYKVAGFRYLLKWVDDFLVIRLPSQTWTEDFIQVTEQIRVPWSHAKMRALASTHPYIGFDWALT